MVWGFLVVTVLATGSLGVTPHIGWRTEAECEHYRVQEFPHSDGYDRDRIVHVTTCFAVPEKRHL